MRYSILLFGAEVVHKPLIHDPQRQTMFSAPGRAPAARERTMVGNETVEGVGAFAPGTSAVCATRGRWLIRVPGCVFKCEIVKELALSVRVIGEIVRIDVTVAPHGSHSFTAPETRAPYPPRLCNGLTRTPRVKEYSPFMSSRSTGLHLRFDRHDGITRRPECRQRSVR